MQYCSLQRYPEEVCKQGYPEEDYNTVIEMLATERTSAENLGWN